MKATKQKRHRLNPFEQIERCPPFLAYAVANQKHKKKRPTVDFMVERSGLPQRTFLRTVQKDDWENVKYFVIKGVFQGCGVNPGDMYEIFRTLRRNGFRPQNLSARQMAKFEAICARNLKR